MLRLASGETPPKGLAHGRKSSSLLQLLQKGQTLASRGRLLEQISAALGRGVRLLRSPSNGPARPQSRRESGPKSIAGFEKLIPPPLPADWACASLGRSIALVCHLASSWARQMINA